MRAPTAHLCSVQGYGQKPPSGHIYPGSGRTADSSSKASIADADASQTVRAADGHAEELVEDPDGEFVGAAADLPHPPGAPRIINVGIQGPGMVCARRPGWLLYRARVWTKRTGIGCWKPYPTAGYTVQQAAPTLEAAGGLTELRPPEFACRL